MSRPSLYTNDLRLAHTLADSVDRVSAARFRDRPVYAPASEEVEASKRDSAPAPLAPWQQVAQKNAEPQEVEETEPPVDYASATEQEIEELIRAQLSRVRLRDGLVGAYSEYNVQASRQWVVAPIAEVDNFRRGVPVWATLIALLDHGEPVVGVVSAPTLSRRWWAARGSGAYTGKSLPQATRLEVSSLTQLNQLSAVYAGFEAWATHEDDPVDRTNYLLHLVHSVGRARSYSSFWAVCMLAEGSVDTLANSSLSFFEVAALLPIIREAGGVASTLEGNLPEHERARRRVSLVASNTASVQERVLQILNGSF